MIKRTIIALIKLGWAKITAPFIYPIWYMFRNKVCEEVYMWLYSWIDVKLAVDANLTVFAKHILTRNGKFWYWLWTYGDMEDPLGRGGLPERCGKNTFWNRYKYSALRNPRFNMNYMELRTKKIVDEHTLLDTRNFDEMNPSPGIGDTPTGKYFALFKDVEGKWYFIYESCNGKSLFYIGWVGLLEDPIGKSGRFEISRRKVK
jgi:hypothetical protein